MSFCLLPAAVLRSFIAKVKTAHSALRLKKRESLFGLIIHTLEPKSKCHIRENFMSVSDPEAGTAPRPGPTGESSPRHFAGDTGPGGLTWPQVWQQQARRHHCTAPRPQAQVASSQGLWLSISFVPSIVQMFVETLQFRILGGKTYFSDIPTKKKKNTPRTKGKCFLESHNISVC